MKTQADCMRELDEIKAFNGWNDRELGALLGTSGALVSNWRTGKTQMTNKSKRRILDFFAEMAIRGKLPSSELPSRPDDIDFNRLLSIWPKLTESMRSRVVSTALELIEKSGYGTQPEGMGGDCPQSKAN